MNDMNNRPSPFLFGLYLRKLLRKLRKIIWLYTHKKVSLQNLKPILPMILPIFNLKCHIQSSVMLHLSCLTLFS